MTPNRPTSVTPFFMVYGAEAVLSTDLDYEAPRVLAYNEAKTEKDQQDALDQLDKAHKTTLLCFARYQQALRRYHNKNVRERAFQVGDLVLRRIQTTKDMHKLTPPKEGPYIIAEVIRLGS